MKKEELLKHIGSIDQIGGIRDLTYNDGRAKGVRVIEIRTGNLTFSVLPDRCMDIAQAYYKGKALSWISKTGITAPTYYEKDSTNWMRGFFGGLLTTCGLKNIGRATEEYGLHGRIANTPAKNIGIFSGWENDEYVMRVTGEMRESCACGENLVLRRTITAKMFSDEITIEDTLVNEGFSDEDIALCYHCNFGYPLVREGSKIINVPEEEAEITAPVHEIKENCVVVDYTDDVVTTGIENGEIGAYVTHKRDTLPDFVIWKMLGEGDYVIGLEPRTVALGGDNIRKNNRYVSLKPFKEYKTYLKLNFKDL